MQVRVTKVDDLSEPDPNRNFSWTEDENGELIEEDARRFEDAVYGVVSKNRRKQ